MASDHLADKYLWGKFGVFELLEQLSDSEAVALFAGMRTMLLATFRTALHPTRDEQTGRDGFILGVKGTLTKLSQWALDNGSFKQVLGYAYLPEECKPLANGVKDRILTHVRHQIIMEMLIEMRDEKDIWYWEDTGTWNFRPGLVWDYDRQQAKIEKRKLNWRNEKNRHGQPSEQSRRRQRQNRTGEAVSIGRGKNSRYVR